MIIGTSDKMTNIIASQLGLSEPEERIYIEDITSEEERNLAHHYRYDEGEHVIPAPVGQLRRDFAGYFMNPLKMIRDRALGNVVSGKSGKDDEDGPADRTVVRPRFSYYGTFSINEQVIRDIIRITADRYSDTLVVADRMSNGKQHNMSVTIDVRAVRDKRSVERCIEFQDEVFNAISSMTAFTLDSVNVRISDIARDYDDLHSRRLH